MTAPDPEDPTFASPTPPGSLPAPDLHDVRLPGEATAAPAGSGTGSEPGPEGGSGSADPRRGVRRRAWIAAAAVVAVAAVVLAGVLGVRTAQDRAWEPLPTDLPAARDAQAVQFVLGTCVEAVPDDGGVSQARAVPCDEEHEAQVVGRTDAATDAVWPGDDVLASRGSRACGPELLGPEARQDGARGARFVVWTPSEESWSEGDRTTLCLVVVAAPRTGSLLD